MALLTFSIKRDAKNKAVERMMREWPARIASMRAMVPYLSAQYVHEHILSKIPRKAEYKAYRMGLALGRVTGLPAEEPAYAVYIDLKNRLVRKVKVFATIVSVRPRKKLATVKPEIKVLEKWSPWTWETLPFKPSRSDAVLVQRKATRAQVSEVTQKRHKQRSQWQRELDKCGIRDIKKDKRLKFRKEARVLPDTAFDAIRLEFGMQGSKARPAWKPALSRLVHQGVHSFIKQKRYFVFPLTRPSDKIWKKHPPRINKKVSAAELKKYQGFQKKLAVRV